MGRGYLLCWARQTQLSLHIQCQQLYLTGCAFIRWKEAEPMSETHRFKSKIGGSRSGDTEYSSLFIVNPFQLVHTYRRFETSISVNQSTRRNTETLYHPHYCMPCQPRRSFTWNQPADNLPFSHPLYTMQQSRDPLIDSNRTLVPKGTPHVAGFVPTKRITYCQQLCLLPFVRCVLNCKCMTDRLHTRTHTHTHTHIHDKKKKAK